MRDRPSDVGLAPYGESPGKPVVRVASAPRRRRPLGRAFTVLGEASSTPGLLDSGRDVLHLRPQHQRPHPDAFHLAVRRLRPAADHGGSALAMMGVFDFFGTIALGLAVRPFRQSARCCSGTTGCAAFRCSICRIRPSRSTACRCSARSTASTGSRPCRRPCGSAQTFGKERAGIASAGYSRRISSARRPPLSAPASRERAAELSAGIFCRRRHVPRRFGDRLADPGGACEPRCVSRQR